MISVTHLFVPAYRLASLGMVVVKDEQAEPAFLLTGKWGQHNDVLDIYLTSGELVAQVKQKSWGWLPKFMLYNHNGDHVGTLRRYYGVGRDMLFVQGLNWLIVGNVLSFNYKVYCGRTLIMTIKKSSSSETSMVEFTIPNAADAPLCLCVAAILNYWAKNFRPKTVGQFNQWFSWQRHRNLGWGNCYAKPENHKTDPN